ncbi:MAG TPA: hypothetical protein VF077_06055 [Nitrospiraceae bacterium]
MRKLVTGNLALMLGMLLLASTALAASNNPKGEYVPFAECPLSRATITDCVHVLSTDGSFTVGQRTVPLQNPVTLQGGFEGEGDAIKFFGAKNGDTLSRTPQPVPGGLGGITAPTEWPVFLQDWFNDLIREGRIGVNATLELTGPSKGLTDVQLNTANLIFEEKTALGLPVKIHLENDAILGPNCYIGSDSDPVQLDFTTGSSSNLKGSAGKSTNNEQKGIIAFSDGKLVNNTFEAPRASGCGGIFSFFVDPLVNETLGLPLGKGKSSAILEGKFQDAQAGEVKASE